MCLAASNTEFLAKRAAEEGGVVVLEGVGAVAVVEEPGGAEFALWQPVNLEPGALGATDGSLVWAEVVTEDPTSTASCYESLLGLKAVPTKNQLSR